MIRPAADSDWDQLRPAVIELQEYEKRLHPTRLPGEQVADAYLRWLSGQVANSGTILVAEIEGTFVGFVAGWIEEAGNVTETPDSNRFGYIADLCVMPAFRGRRIAGQLLNAIEHHLGHAGITRIRIASLAANRSARTAYERAQFHPYEVIYEKIVSDDWC